MEDSQNIKDEKYIKRALELASQGRGSTSPNPLVGALIVKNNEIISEAYHEKAGQDHAEIIAIKKAGYASKDSTLYLNLEPCCHYGKTPPCTKAIIEASIKRVVIGCKDENEKVNGKSIEILKQAGIEVKEGVLEEECKEFNKFFFHWIKTGFPYVSLKIACSLNAKVNRNKNIERINWISGEQSRIKVHELRSLYDCVLTGSGTVLADNPMLTVRSFGGRNPLRVVLDRRGRCPLNSKIFDPTAKTLVFSSKDQTLKEILYDLGKKENLSILVEAGPKLITSFLDEDLFQDIFYFINPNLIIQNNNKSFYLGDKELNLKLKEIKNLGEDLMLYFKS